MYPRRKQVLSRTCLFFYWLFVNYSGLTKSHTLERTELVLSFLIFKATRKIVKVPKAKGIALDYLDKVVSSL